MMGITIKARITGDIHKLDFDDTTDGTKDEGTLWTFIGSRGEFDTLQFHWGGVRKAF